jgi:hypothetical protein
VSSRKRRKFREQLRQDVEEAEKRLKEQGITVNDNHGEAPDDCGSEKKKKRRRLKKTADKGLESKRKEKSSDEEENGDPPGASEAIDEKGEDTKTKRRRKKKGRKLASVAADQNFGAHEDFSKLKAPAVQSEIPKPKAPDATTSKSIETLPSEVQKSPKKKKKKDKKKGSVEGVSAARLASYGL